ncbi:hypothetical protein MUK42_11957, partial [Musa troglodytarum]
LEQLHVQHAGVAFEVKKGPNYYGTSADLDVFQLSGISINQASTSQIILTKGERGPKNYINTVQAGWHVSNGIFVFLFFVFCDDYQKTGCLNLLCPGFVQTSTRITPGQIYTLHSLSLSIYRDRFTSNWMLYNDREPIGYWPKEIFNNLADCSQVQIGGFAYSPFDEASPPMGSGVLFGAKFTNVVLVDGQGNNRKPEDFAAFHDLSQDYYGTSYSINNGVLSYGGPGGWKKT